MEWLLDHIQLLFVAGGAIAWWLKQRREAQETDSAPPPAPVFTDPELAEKTRRIREEIQRKIQQRTRGESVPAPRSEVDEEPPVIATLPARPDRASVNAEARRRADILEEQAALAEQLQEAQLMKAATAKRTEFEEATADHVTGARVETRALLLGDLGNRDALRRAFVLREVLGPPVGLRRG